MELLKGVFGVPTLPWHSRIISASKMHYMMNGKLLVFKALARKIDIKEALEICRSFLDLVVISYSFTGAPCGNSNAVAKSACKV